MRSSAPRCFSHLIYHRERCNFRPSMSSNQHWQQQGKVCQVVVSCRLFQIQYTINKVLSLIPMYCTCADRRGIHRGMPTCILPPEFNRWSTDVGEVGAGDHEPGVGGLTSLREAHTRPFLTPFSPLFGPATGLFVYSVPPKPQAPNDATPHCFASGSFDRNFPGTMNLTVGLHRDPARSTRTPASHAHQVHLHQAREQEPSRGNGAYCLSEALVEVNGIAAIKPKHSISQVHRISW